MKILILGCNGMVGHIVTLWFKEHGYDIYGYDETSSEICPTTVDSFHNEKQIISIMENLVPDAIINCTAIINEDADADKAEAAFINSYLPHFLEKITSNTNTIFIHRSTDCIFSGSKGNYSLTDIPDASSFYARTKAIGEVINDKDITIRTSLIGPEMCANGSGLFNWYYQQNESVKGFKNAIWTGLTTIEFAKEIESLLLQKEHGLFQLVPDTAINKCDLLKLFSSALSDKKNIIEVDNKRVDKSLKQECQNANIAIPDYGTMITEMVNWIKDHKQLYPHYIL